jgi:hypothetical protein
MEMELATMTLFTDSDGVERLVHAWRRAGDDAERSDEEERRR